MPLDELTSDLEVLVVDDEPTVRELLLEYFAGLGFRVTGAEDGRGAISVLQRAWGRFGLVVTDLNLPGADGFAVLQVARQLNPACFVVIITGYASLDSAIRAVRVGAFDYLTKPFSLAQLDLILTRIRDRRAQQAGQPPAPSPVSSVPLPASIVTATPPVPKPAPVAVAVPQASPSSGPPSVPTVPADSPAVVPADTTQAVLADPSAGVASALVPDVLPPHLQYSAMSSYNVAQRLGLLEAAFNRIEALLREQQKR